jgi:hypothetical protein
MLTITDCASEQDLGFAATWGNPYPPLPIAQIRILTANEPNAQKKRQGFVVFGDQQ